MGLSNGGETLAVQGDRTQRLQGGAVAGRAVALVAVKGKVGKAAAQLPHQAVAGDLGTDRGGGDGQAGGVGPDDGRLSVGEPAGGVQRKGVDDHVLACCLEHGAGALEDLGAVAKAVDVRVVRLAPGVAELLCGPFPPRAEV